MTTPRKDPPLPPAIAARMDPWMSLKEAADALGIHTQTVLGRATAGLLVTQVVAGRTFVHRDSVLAQLQHDPEPLAAAG